MGTPAFVAALFGGFASIALLLASVGLYSVVSHTVTQRTGATGIRMALGARKNHILKLVFASIAASLLAELSVGLAVSIGLNKLGRRQLAQSANPDGCNAGAYRQRCGGLFLPRDGLRR